ncbi:hypothetical protein [Catenulispora subtropica]|uniref:hypothetical protein n=1 Tax=Catenulispora subtropica TaxID=450798 RepID=UPI0031D49DFC
MQGDAEQVEDRIWARAAADLGIQHVHARAGRCRIDLAVFLAGAAPPESSNGASPVQNILALLPEWTLTAPDEGYEA